MLRCLPEHETLLPLEKEADMADSLPEDNIDVFLPKHSKRLSTPSEETLSNG